MANKRNPKIKNREFDPNQPTKRLYFYPKHKQVARTEEEAKKKAVKKQKSKKQNAKSN